MKAHFKNLPSFPRKIKSHSAIYFVKKDSVYFSHWITFKNNCEIILQKSTEV